MILVVAIISIIPLRTEISDYLLNFIIKCIIFQISIPVYVILILAITFIFYFIRIKQKYNNVKIGFQFLIGTWHNEYQSQGRKGYEICEIKDDGKYLIDGQHYFDIIDFNYNARKNQITFTKKAVRENDNRKLKNIMNIENNFLLTGTEEDVDRNFITKYTKIN